MLLSPLVLFLLASLCPAAIANPTPIPMIGQGWVVTSIASNSVHPTMTDNHHINQPQYRCPWLPTGNQPWWWCGDDDHLDSDKPYVDSCMVLTPHQWALLRGAHVTQQAIAHDLPNLAGLYGSVNWHSQCTCEVYWSYLLGYLQRGPCTPFFAKPIPIPIETFSGYRCS